MFKWEALTVAMLVAVGLVAVALRSSLAAPPIPSLPILVGRGACGRGTIAFRSYSRPRPPYACLQGDYYAGGKRDFIAQLSQPAGSHYLELVLVHIQSSDQVGQGGILVQKEMYLADPRARVVQGTIDFSGVYHRLDPAGGAPWGQYYLSIYRARAVRLPLLAVGELDVIED